MGATKPLKVKFKDYDCWVQWATYKGGRIAMRLVDEHNEGPVATATVNLPEHPLPDGYVLIKSWSENEGMVEALEAAGIVEHIALVPAGYVFAHLCKLLVQPPKGAEHGNAK